MTVTTIADKIDIALLRIDDAVQSVKPIAVVGLYSGGHDSCSACKVASLHPAFSGVLHINTGIGIEATRSHVRATAASQGWHLWEYKALEATNAKGDPAPQDYDAIVLENGFPGPATHSTLYARLKERALRCFMRDMGANGRGKAKRRILLIAGCRSQESARRMGTVEPLQVFGRDAWANPIHDWSKLDTTLLLDHYGIARNPVVDLIHKSGECLCGAFAKPGELAELALWPETRPAYERICALQERVKAAGFDWGWEGAPARRPRAKGTPPEQQLLCLKCNLANAAV